jgi:hypothetical protein
MNKREIIRWILVWVMLALPLLISIPFAVKAEASYYQGQTVSGVLWVATIIDVFWLLLLFSTGAVWKLTGIKDIDA